MIEGLMWDSGETHLESESVVTGVSLMRKPEMAVERGHHWLLPFYPHQNSAKVAFYSSLEIASENELRKEAVIQ